MRILVVEDDQDLSRQLKQMLKDAGYAVDVAHDGEEGHYLGDTEPYDAVVLDLGLPLIDGVSVLQKWRADGKTFPVIILTARDQWSEKVAGFDAGADDYLTKPFHTEELMARLRALMRRASGHSTDTIEIGDLMVDNRAARAFVDGMAIKLTRTELVEHIYDQDFDRDSNTIEVFVGRLRRKIGTDRIETVRGLGYRLTDPNDSKA